LFKDDPTRREAADKQLRAIDGLVGIAIVVKPQTLVSGSGKQDYGDNRRSGILSNGRPVPATPRRSEAIAVLCQYQQLRIIGCTIHHGVSRLRRTFGLYRFFGSREGDGLQLSVEGSLFAQFNLNTLPSTSSTRITPSAFLSPTAMATIRSASALSPELALGG